MCWLRFTLTKLLEESESENKKLPSREIKISDECVYDLKKEANNSKHGT